MNLRPRQMLSPALAIALLSALTGCGGAEDAASTDNTLITELNQLDTVDGTISDDMTVLDGTTMDSDNAVMAPDAGAMDNVAESGNAL